MHFFSHVLVAYVQQACAYVIYIWCQSHDSNIIL